MSDRNTTTLNPEARTRVERPRLYKVLLLNDDFTPREFVVAVLAAEFRMSEDEAARVMITAHQQGVCVVAVFPRDVAETKASRASDAGKANGFPLRFETEPEE
ncbi:ATP-dependent Clp protease adapter ClpS [Stappia sp.]|jgi:ATP-dependent Clp protease adaptor protein ClpS|uniref:ATP-dependent Clp protease adapter ClpS n=1 Tax=Stappia sp. TaxID=1870903 RepID=UPI003A993611